MRTFISSTQNKLIKQLLLLKEKSRERRKQNLFVIEGIREITLAKQAFYEITHLFYCRDYISDLDLKYLISSIDTSIEVSSEVYKKIAYRATTEGVIAIMHSKQHSLDALKFTSKNPLILVAEAPEKPGNIGAFLRTADAANLDAVIIANPKTDIYNPNIIRSSVGCVFTNTIAFGTTEEIITFLKNNNIAIYSATLQTDILYTTKDYTKSTAIVVGSEATGLSKTWRTASDSEITIPMQGKIDSLNVSVSAGILLFEAKRQRHF